jgi:hypothetical protein
LVPKKGLGCRTGCFQSLTVVLQPTHSCSITSFWNECASSNGSPRPGVQAFEQETQAATVCSLYCSSCSTIRQFRWLPGRLSAPNDF